MLLNAQNISFKYESSDLIFEDVNLKLKHGEILSIVGPSGVGKSTLLKCLGGLLSLESGEIAFEGKKLPDPKLLLKPGHPEIAIVNQIFQFDPFFTVEENIQNQLHHLPNEVRDEFLEELLDIVELESVRHLKSRDISGGEQQRLSLACALAKEPKCLLLDEPFVHLDVHLNKKIGQYLRKLVEIRDLGVILVTHNGAESLSWSDKIVMLKNGKITSRYTPQTAYFKPKNLFDGRFFGELNSIYDDGKQVLFRPTEYSVKQTKNALKIDVNWIYSNFRGHIYANYFKLKNGKEIVLYAQEELQSLETIYVKKAK